MESFGTAAARFSHHKTQAQEVSEEGVSQARTSTTPVARRASALEAGPVLSMSFFTSWNNRSNREFL